MQFACLYFSLSVYANLVKLIQNIFFSSYNSVPIFCKINKNPEVTTYIEEILPGAVYTVYDPTKGFIIVFKEILSLLSDTACFRQGSTEIIIFHISWYKTNK